MNNLKEKLQNILTLGISGIKAVWDKIKIFAYIGAAIALIIEYREILMSLIISSSKKAVDEATKKSDSLKKEENEANKKANDLVNHANQLKNEENDDVSEDWNKKK